MIRVRRVVVEYCAVTHNASAFLAMHLPCFVNRSRSFASTSARFVIPVLFALLGLLTVNAMSQVSPAASASSTPIASELQPFSTELERLKARVDQQQQQISRQQGMIKANARRREGNSTALFTRLGVVVAALVGGYFALRNQNAQAGQGRLLKAVELIMESRSGYQADIRTKNLSVFLDDETKKHLEKIKTDFAGPEYTDLHVALAEAMSERAKTPVEVLAIWKSVLQEKKFFDGVSYPAENKPNG